MEKIEIKFFELCGIIILIKKWLSHNDLYTQILTMTNHKIKIPNFLGQIYTKSFFVTKKELKALKLNLKIKLKEEKFLKFKKESNKFFKISAPSINYFSEDPRWRSINEKADLIINLANLK